MTSKILNLNNVSSWFENFQPDSSKVLQGIGWATLGIVTALFIGSICCKDTKSTCEDLRAKFHLLRAKGFIKQGQYTQALEAIQKGFSIQPTGRDLKASLYLQRSKVFNLQGYPIQALEAAQTGLDTNPIYKALQAGLHLQRAESFRTQGRYFEAMKAVSAAFSADPLSDECMKASLSLLSMLTLHLPNHQHHQSLALRLVSAVAPTVPNQQGVLLITET